MQHLSKKRILVTGACGTIGEELISQLAAMGANGPKEIIGIDSNESELFFIDQEYRSNDKIKFWLCNLRDKATLTHLFDGIDIVFHAAALKHVIMCEQSPMEAVQTNIIGVQNVIQAALANDLEKVIFTSSDKAVNPTNVMGTSKLMGERLITAANITSGSKQTIFSSTRFGNVLGSNGSVFPIFKRQIEQGGPVTVTDKHMTRFVMSIYEAAQLVLNSSAIAKGSEVFVTKMPIIKIADLAEVMIDELAGGYGHNPKDIKIEEIGVKPGEKLYEELMTDEETRRTIELSKFFCVRPAFANYYKETDFSFDDVINTEVDRPYNSHNETALTKAEIRKLLKDYKLIL